MMVKSLRASYTGLCPQRQASPDSADDAPASYLLGGGGLHSTRYLAHDLRLRMRD
jgi:hypothetical protein